MAKVRVHELAKELGLTSKDLLTLLKDMGEFVKSASSTIEAPVVRRVTEKVGASGTTSSEPAAPAAPAKAQAIPAPTQPVAPAPEPVAPLTADTPDVPAAKPSVPKPVARKAAPGPVPGPSKPAPKPAPQRPNFQPGMQSGAPTPTATPRPTAPRPGPAAPKPGQSASTRKPGAPRPGNNPYASSQGMGQRRQGGQGGQGSQDRTRPGQDRPREGRDGQRPGGAPRPGGEQHRMPRPGGTSGIPQPNPGMMPKRQNNQLGNVGAPTRGGQGGRSQSGPGRGRGGQGGRGPSAPGTQGGVGAPGMGAPLGGGRGGRGGRGGSGAQGAFGRPGGTGGRKGRKSKKQRRQEFDEMQAPVIGGVRIKQGDGEVVRLRRGSSLTDFAEKIGVDAAALVQVLFHLGEMVTATQSVSDATLEVLGAELNYVIEVVSPEDEDRELLESFDLEFGEDAGSEEDLEARPPVVTVMGHVDHGKTKLLDAFRRTHVVEGEAGGITQAIGAYQVETNVDGVDRMITFIDTPGHEAFTQMRARGAKATDIAVLVVAADDGVMPQTIEALNHAKAADVPVVVAVNKMDKEAADPTRVRTQLMEFGLVPEEYGGDTMFVNVSAVTGLGLDELLEAVILTADAALDLRANPNMDAQGVAIEAHLDKGRGPVTTVLVQRGTLRIGDSLVAGSAHGRVRAMINDRGKNVEVAPPSMPVQVLGLTSVPGAGDNLLVVDDDRMARQIADKREARMRAAAQALGSRRKTLDQLFEQLEKGETQELLLVLKGDGAGSVEALEDALSKIDVGDEVSLRVIDRGVGAITETNVSLAAASNPHAVILGFNVRPTVQAAKLADAENVDIRYYSVIYQAIDDIEAALKGMLKPIYEEKALGTAEIREVFHSSKIGNIAGCMVVDGIMRRNAKARLVRDGVVVTETTIGSLRREKDDATEVREGYECGLTLHNYNDIRVGDLVETYEMVEKARPA